MRVRLPEEITTKEGRGKRAIMQELGELFHGQR